MIQEYYDMDLTDFQWKPVRKYRPDPKTSGANSFQLRHRLLYGNKKRKSYASDAAVFNFLFHPFGNIQRHLV
jgi:hypothetical protein